MLDGLARVLGPAQQNAVRACGRQQRQLVEGQDLAASLHQHKRTNEYSVICAYLCWRNESAQMKRIENGDMQDRAAFQADIVKYAALLTEAPNP